MMSAHARPARGRPLLSHARILDTALELLQQMPLKELTMRRLAQALNTTPAALYGYFASQEELFAAVATRVVRGIDLSAVHSAAHWQERLRLWARAVRARQLEFASTAAMAQISPHIPASWFEVTAPLLRALESAGLSDQALMDTARCYSRIVYGSILTELAQDPYALQVERADAEAALGQLSPQAAEQIAGILPYLGTQDNEALFEMTIDCALRGIAAALPPPA
jgi:TetR/AcrR family transcriptional regulator, tetracycline repressor protein